MLWKVTLMMGVPLGSSGAGVQGIVWNTEGEEPDEIITDPANASETFKGKWKLMSFDRATSTATYGRMPQGSTASPKDVYTEQVIEEEYLDSLGEGARRDWLRD